MGNVDSLSIKVDASARDANQQLDKLVQKMMQLRSTVNGINVGNLNKVAGSIQNFSKAVTGLNQVKTSDFTRMAKNLEKLTKINTSNLDKSAKSVEKAAGSLQKATSMSKKAISAGLKFDSSGVQDMQKAIQSMSNEFADAGKGKIFGGTLSDLEKSADKLRKKLDDLAEREEKILAVGGTSSESKGFKNLQYDISKTLNQLSQLEDAITKVRATEQQDDSSFPIFRYDAPSGEVESSGIRNFREKVQNAFQDIPETARYSVKNAKKALEDALKEVHIGEVDTSSFRNYTEEIKSLKAELKGLEQSGRGMGSDEWEKVYLKLRTVTLEAKEYKNSMDNPATGLDEDIKKTDSLGNHVESLKAKLKDMQSNGLNFCDAKFDSTYKELQKATAELKKYKSSLVDSGNTTKSVADKITGGFRSIWNMTKKAGSGIASFGSKVKSLTTRFHSMSSSTDGLIGKIMKLYIAFQSLRGVGNFIKDSVESSMDYIEEYNYFNTTMEKIAGEWSKDFKKYGYENAEEYGKSFNNRITKTIGKMTGFKMEDDGTLTDIGSKNLGLDVTQMTNYAAGVAQVTNSVGMAGEASIVTSKALSMLAGDMSSFRNQDMSTVMNNFSSGLIGQSRALYQYGIDITNATLATYAHDMGIKKNISDMTQAEKMQLRMIAILNQSRVSWGDLAKTINSPSNQLRLLQNNFKALSRIIGNIFLPVVAKVLPYINGLVIAIRRLFEWTASMLGIDLKDIIGNSGVGGGNAFDGLEEDANNASDAVDDTTDSVKKLAKQLMGFDELNVINTNQNSSSSGSSDDGSGAPIDLTSQLSAALADYEKVWNDAYKNMTSDAEKFADKLTKLFKDAWTSGDGSDIGSAIASWINKGIAWVNKNVDTFAAGLKKIANLLATGVNGFVSELDWAGLGTAIGKSLKAYFDAETHFFDKVDWVNFGKSLATSLNAAIDSGVIQSYIKSVASKLRAAIEVAFGAITTFNFSGLGKAIGQGINDFFDKMGKVNPKTGLNGWQELAVSISDGIKGIATTITTAWDTVDWEDVGQAIADFITGIDWKGVVWSLGEVVQSFADALKGVLSGAGVPESLANLVVKVGIGGWIIKKLSKTALGKVIAGKIGSKLSVPLKRVGAVIANWFSNKKGVALSKLKNAIVSKVGKLSVGFKKVAVAVKSWIAGDVKLADLITKIKTGLGVSKGTLSLGSLATKIAVKIPAFAFPDPATDDLVRKIDTWFTNKIWKPICRAIPWLDEDSEMGVFQIVVNPFIKILGGAWDDTTAMTEGIDVGNDFASGFLKGFADALIYPAMLIYNSIVKPVKDVLGIHSPSTVFQEIAENCIKGFTNGFNLAKKIAELLGGVKDNAVSVVLNVVGSLDEKAKEIKGWFANKKEKAKEFLAKAKGKIGKTFGDVKDAWNKFREKTKEVLVKAKGKVEEAFDTVKDTWKKFKQGTKTVWAKAKGKAEDEFNKISEKWSSFKDGVKDLWVKAKGKIEDTFDDAILIWNDVKGGAKDIWVNAKGEFDKTFNEVADAWKKVQDKAATLTANAIEKTKSVFKSIKAKWGDIRSKTETLTANAVENTKSVFASILGKWSGIKSKTSSLTANAIERGASVFKRIKSAWNSISNKTSVLTATFNDLFTRPLKSAWNAIAKTINSAIKTINKIPGVNIGARLPALAKGGIYSGGVWRNIARYADGGLPGMGQMFVAREAGPELVGTIGGHTAVMNNNQIVASVSDGVFNALNPVLTSLVNAINLMVSASANGNGDVYVEIDGDNIARVVRRKNSDYRKRTGKGMFEV